ncbi:MAG: hypothetical protein JXR97_06915 [Planctomycetes bacterium]|nr:hypothetical protein [Planctomycetota bacterium]
MEKQASQRHAKRTWHRSELFSKHHPDVGGHNFMHRMEKAMAMTGRRARRRRIPILCPHHMRIGEYIEALPQIKKLFERINLSEVREDIL